MNLSKETCLELGKQYIEKHKVYPAARKWTITTAGCSRDRIYENWGGWAAFISDLRLLCEIPNIIKLIPNTGLVEMCDNKVVSILVPKNTWNKESVLAKLLESAKDYGTPKRKHFIKNKNYPSLATVNKYFGSWAKAVECCNLNTNKKLPTAESIEQFLTRELASYVDYLPDAKTLADVVFLFKSGAKKAKWNANTAVRFTDKFNNKIKGQPYHIWFLASKHVKWCRSCDLVLTYDQFSLNTCSTDKMQAYCKVCTSDLMKKYSSRGANSRTAVLRATPVWVNTSSTESVYRHCPEGYHVDHIVPLQGVNVCGLHVPWNLQYLPAKENIQKSNKFDGGWARWEGSAFTPRY